MMQELSLINTFLALIESPYAIILLCGVLIYSISRLGYRNIQLKLENTIEKKASKEEVKEINDKINDIEVEIALLKGKLNK